MHTMVKVLPHKLLDADKTWFSSLKITSKFVLAKFQVCCTYHHPRGTHLHMRVEVHAGIFENDPYKIIKNTWVLSVWEWQKLMSIPKKYQFKWKNWKILKIKIPWSMCSRGSSQVIKIVLVMLISGVLLSEKQPKTYQPGLCFFFTPKRYDKYPCPFPIAFSPQVST